MTRITTALIIPLLAGSVNLSLAEEYANPGDEPFRFRSSKLSDSGQIEQLLTVWPVLQANNAQPDVADEFDNGGANPQNSPDFISSPNVGEIQNRVILQVGANTPALRGFDSDTRTANQLTLSTERVFGPFVAHLEASVIDPKSNGENVVLDGSYLAADWNQWRLGFGSLDRWWGPGWQTSLILSNNARPTPGFFIERNTHRSSDLPILKLLGPWHVTAFANQMEKNRAVPDAKLLGARFTFKPFDSLELGLSRTAQWGGEGRPENFDNLIDLILGKDNVGSDGIELDGSNEPGNQLGGFDFRWTSQISGHRFSIYGQLIGEDEAGGLPSREIGMLGLDTDFNTQFSEGFIFAEASDTGMNFLNGTMFNSTYNHHIYQTGYRYYGESIGASTDNDSRLYTLGGYQEIGHKQSLTWKAHYASLNRDGVDGRNSLTTSHLQTVALAATYSHQLTENSSIGFQAHHFLNNTLPASTGLSKSSIQIRVSLFN